MMTSKQSVLRPAKHNNPCPVCGKPDWCSIADNRSYIVCMRISEGSFKETKNGGYLHIFNERENNKQPKWGRAIILDEPEIAAIKRRHEVYTAFLEMLTLDKRHADDLVRRGMSEEIITQNLYASVPTDSRKAKAICEELEQRFDIAFIPGFYKVTKGLNIKVSDWHNGFFVPVRDIQGRIQGLQIRREVSPPRYVWLSSKDLPNGSPSKTWVHYARPYRAESTGIVVITEGALKADISAERMDLCVVAVSGVSAFNVDFSANLKNDIQNLERVYIAYDSDWRDNLTVSNALVKLADNLRLSGLSGYMWDWQGHKGIDDLLVGGAQ